MKERIYQHPRLNCFKERRTGSWFMIAAAALALLGAQMAQAQTHAVLKNFTGSDGQYPEAGLVLSGSTLYGTTLIGGSSGNGTVFKDELSASREGCSRVAQARRSKAGESGVG
jgi:uncharacterized repeat protein (TIGR03803 family)